MTDNTEQKVVSIGKEPAVVRPEMIVRHLLARVDKLEQIAVVAQVRGEAPMVLISDGTSQYVLALGAALLEARAIDKLPRGSHLV